MAVKCQPGVCRRRMAKRRCWWALGGAECVVTAVAFCLDSLPQSENALVDLNLLHLLP